MQESATVGTQWRPLVSREVGSTFGRLLFASPAFCNISRNFSVLFSKCAKDERGICLEHPSDEVFGLGLRFIGDWSS